MKIDKYLISDQESIKSALKKIDNNHLGIIFVHHNHKIVGVATDGDIRRSLLKSNTVNSKIASCMNNKFKYLYEDKSSRQNILKALSTKIRVLPILSKDKNLVSVVSNKEISWNTTVHKPWGYFNLLIKTDDYLVKEIVIFPKQSISLQMHNHRSEHWIVLSGKAEITIGSKKQILKDSESTFVPVKKKHKITNNSTRPLIILETQLGNLLSEDDITRFEDQYGRKIK